MKRCHALLIPVVVAVVAAALPLGAEEPAKSSEVQAKASAQPPREPMIFASPIHGGCYIAAPGQCKIHVEPFTINVASTKKLVFFQLMTIQGGVGTQRVIYDWRPDQSNRAPHPDAVTKPGRILSAIAVALLASGAGGGGSVTPPPVPAAGETRSPAPRPSPHPGPRPS